MAERCSSVKSLIYMGLHALVTIQFQGTRWRVHRAPRSAAAIPVAKVSRDPRSAIDPIATGDARQIDRGPYERQEQ